MKKDLPMNQSLDEESEKNIVRGKNVMRSFIEGM
jgi:hypothetical protein